jgi:hypothetical protein
MVSFHFFLLALAAALATTNSLLQCPALLVFSGGLRLVQVQFRRMSLSEATSAPRRGLRQARREARDSINRILFDAPRTKGAFIMLPPARLQATRTTLLGWQCERHFRPNSPPCGMQSLP